MPFYWESKILNMESGINFITVSQSELEAISDMIVAHSIYVTPTLFMEEAVLQTSRSGAEKGPLAQADASLCIQVLGDGRSE